MFEMSAKCMRDEELFNLKNCDSVLQNKLADEGSVEALVGTCSRDSLLGFVGFLAFFYRYMRG